jgi:hypothetical protein
LVRCRLLLAPTPDELKLADQDVSDPKGEASLTEISALPTFLNCKTALRAWRDDMGSLSVPDGERSRALFMFFGHGIQVTDRSLLLPTDWLGSKGSHGPNWAFSPQNLVNGLSQIPVLQQWFFCDACRSSTGLLDGLRRLEGTDVLEEMGGDCYRRSFPIVYSSSLGMAAFEPGDPRLGCTFFGGTLLDGLSAKSDTVVNCDPKPCRIEFDLLMRFLKAETIRRLTSAGIEQIEGAGPPTGAVLGGQYQLDNPTVAVLLEHEDGPAIAKSEPQTSTTVSDALAAGDSISRVGRFASAGLETYPEQPFGSERLTAFFMRAQFVSAAGKMTSATFDGIRRSGSNCALKLEVTLRNPMSKPIDRGRMMHKLDDVWIEHEYLLSLVKTHGSNSKTYRMLGVMAVCSGASFRSLRGRC